MPSNLLVSDVSTRWNSCFNMIKVFLEQHRAIEVLYMRHGKEYPFEETDINIITSSQLLLEPVAIASNILESDDSFYSVTLPVIRNLYNTIDRINLVMNREDIYEIKENLLSRLKHRFSH
eukprot:TRINITY_DN1218_c0_g1_i1.p1 TRINITY_DN1218_c0_g1~~TRINITY_DN1218_c0_g1_i1.p1  ORF type:complete len:120 (-),score=21.40 TRINITY_DN1218_c0_g1_i1:566-925(-)